MERLARRVQSVNKGHRQVRFRRILMFRMLFQSNVTRAIQVKHKDYIRRNMHNNFIYLENEICFNRYVVSQ